MTEKLPIEDAVPELMRALKSRKRAVLHAPPGAGKTTHVPLAILQAGLCPGRILMLEPRRLAARAAAERMAKTLGEKPGERIGYSMRGESKTGPKTRVEVVTEGILTRMIQSNPALTGIDAIIFGTTFFSNFPAEVQHVVQSSVQTETGLVAKVELRTHGDVHHWQHAGDIG